MILSDITLLQLIELNEQIKPLDDEYIKVFQSDAGEIRKSILLTGIFVKKAQKTYEEFGEKSTSDTKPISVDFLVCWYNDFLALFDELYSDKWCASVGLSVPELTHMSPVTFGQFIDAKMITEAAIRDKTDKWQAVQYVMSIFMCKEYDDTFTSEGSEQFIRCGKMGADVALKVSKWWDALTTYINEHYTVFQDSGAHREHTDNMDAHMQKWGWVNFLKGIAKTKAFDISGSGLNSIDCVRKTKASEILVWSSEEKDYNVASNEDMKEAYK